MKKALIFLLLIVATSTICAQRCYFVKAKNGTKLYKEGRYSEARALFVEAKSCPDRPKSGKEMDSWIKRCDDKIKEQKSFDTDNKKSQSNSSNISNQSSNSSRTSTTSSNKASATASFLYVSSSKELTYTSAGGTKSIDVYCDAEWEVAIATASWVHLTRNGNKITIRVESNILVTDRTDYFVLKSGEKTCRVDIKQNGVTPYLSVSSTFLQFKTEGGEQTIHVTTNCEWKVSVSPAYWVQLTQSGNDITLKVHENYSKGYRSDYFVITARGERIKINISQEYIKPHGFFIKEDGFASNFINFNGGYNIKNEKAIIGLSYSFIKSHLGFRISGYMELEKTFNSYIVTFDPVFRLTNDNSALDLQFYIGGGVYNGSPIGEMGFRFAWKSERDLSLWDFSLGCMGTLDRDVIPTLGLGVAIPFSPIIGIGSWLSKPVGFYDFSKHFFDVTRSVNSNWGISYSYIPKRSGWYVSTLFDNNNLGIVTGPVIRIVPQTNEVDFQLYGGVGYFRKVIAYDFGIRIAPTPNRAFSWWDITMGVTSIDGMEYFTIGTGLGISAVVGLLFAGYSGLNY